MRPWVLAFLIVAVVLCGQPNVAMAGMPTVSLSDIARMRFQTISFFLLVLLLSSWGIQRIWNSLTTDFPKLPRLSYGKSLGVVILWGLLFVIVLTMISGARELMTPGAWEKQGLTYRLKEKPSAEATPPKAEQSQQLRQSKLERLGLALMHFAAEHDGRFPNETEAKEIPEETWQLPNRNGLRYLYRPGLTTADRDSLLAFEVDVYEGAQLVLFANGNVAPMGQPAIRAVLGLEEGQP